MDECCVNLLTLHDGLLRVANALGELRKDRQRALDNLGVTDKINELIELINSSKIHLDETPTVGSIDNGVTSNGIAIVINRLNDSLNELLNIIRTIQDSDYVPTKDSSKFVVSGGLYNYIEDLNRTITDLIPNNLQIKTLSKEVFDENKHTLFEESLGQSSNIGISQKFLTDIISNLQESYNNLRNIVANIWKSIQTITGEDDGIIMTVTPTYFTGEDGAELNISFDSGNSPTNFETIKFYANDEEIASYEDIDKGSFTHTIYADTVIKCVATLMGVEYTKEQAVNKIMAFYIGGGLSYADVMTEECKRDVGDSLDGIYNITLADNDKIIIVIDATYESLFNRADMNGFEIPITKTVITVDDTEYAVFESVNRYEAGTYNIAINN